MSYRSAFLSSLMVLASICLRADDGAASVAAGGLIVMKREPRITMSKEVLRISGSKVVVDYEFRNDSDEDITTEVAFPIPDYDHDLDRAGIVAGFNDFQLFIDGAASRYQVEARALLKNTEYTQLLTRMHVDIASFGHAPLDGNGKDIERLTSDQRKRLESAGLIVDNEPFWRVKKKYYWRQRFAAHQIVHIRHEYSPLTGSSNSIGYGMKTDPDLESAKEIKSFCIEGGLQTILQGIANGKVKDRSASYNYIDFILTTANTWKTPIEDFTLIVERYHGKNNLGERDLADYVSFCWDGPVTKIDADHFSAHATNFVPTKELRIGFFSVEHSRF